MPTIYTGDSRRCRTWKPLSVSWETFTAMLSNVTRTPEKFIEYQLMSHDQRGEIKDVGGFVGGVLRDGQRRKSSVESRTLLTLDLDNAAPDAWEQLCQRYHGAMCVYSTHSHTPEQPRLRLVCPLDRPCSPNAYEPMARMAAKLMGVLSMCDATTFDPSRLMYWPSASSDAPVVFESQEGKPLPVEGLLNQYHDFTDSAEWPLCPDEAERSASTSALPAARRPDRPQPPADKGGVIGAYCQTYDIRSLIDGPLAGIYKPAQGGRYTYCGSTTTGGLVVYQNGAFAYSNHTHDPACGILCNAFDLMRIHLADGDFNKAIDIALNDPKCKAIVPPPPADTPEVAFADVRVDDIDDSDPADTLGLDATQKGGVKPSRKNIVLILSRHEAFAGKIKYNEFTARITVDGELPWPHIPGKSWSDNDDAALRTWLDTKFNINNNGNVSDAVAVVAMQNRYNPLTDWLDSLEWDGSERLDTLFVRVLGAEDTPYTRQLTRMHLCAAVARAYRPGTKYDYMLVLQGPESVKKSSTIRALCPMPEWYTESISINGNKDDVAQLQGKWLGEYAELAGMTRADRESVKAFITRQCDSVRPAYGRHVVDIPRTTVFFGSTNETMPLSGDTGNRRFALLPVAVNAPTAPENYIADNLDQIWAEAKFRWRNGEKLYLPDELEAVARDIQRTHNIESLDPLPGQIDEFLNTPKPKGWRDRSPAERRQLEAISAAADGGEELTSTCAAEIVFEVLGMKQNQAGYYTMARKVSDIMNKNPEWERISTGRFGKMFGRQRGWRRKKLPSEDDYISML